jgi:hypothetical protein
MSRVQCFVQELIEARFGAPHVDVIHAAGDRHEPRREIERAFFGHRLLAKAADNDPVSKDAYKMFVRCHGLPLRNAVAGHQHQRVVNVAHECCPDRRISRAEGLMISA